MSKPFSGAGWGRQILALFSVGFTACTVVVKSDKADAGGGPGPAGDAASSADARPTKPAPADAGAVDGAAHLPDGSSPDAASPGDAAAACPGATGSGLEDTDRDGVLDACDDDDDDDGFLDEDDPAPTDATNPGDFSTVDRILDDARVKAALDASRAAGVTIPTHTEREPPTVAGTYRSPENTGVFVATGDNNEIGIKVVGLEARHGDLSPALEISSSSVNFANGAPISYAIAEGNLLRGKGTEFTIYRRFKAVCTESNSRHSRWGIGITSATVDPQGNWDDVLVLNVTIAASGTLTSACATRTAGNAEVVGGWSVSRTPTHMKVAASELEYMCVAAEHAYAPTESWPADDGGVCLCTEAYAISCG
jgi:hypothetical protein